MKKNIFILVIAITLCGISFALGNSLNKSNKQEDMNKENKKEELVTSPKIVLDGVFKAKYTELGTDKYDKEYYVIFIKGGKVYAIDEDGVIEGSYSDIYSSEEKRFSLQIGDFPISTCKYENDNIKCDEQYEFVKKMK